MKSIIILINLIIYTVITLKKHRHLKHYKIKHKKECFNISKQ